MAKQKNNMEILKEIREKRNNDLEMAGRNDISVTKVEVLGKGEKSKKMLYRLIEERNIENSETGEIDTEITEMFYEYKNAPKLIGVRNSNTQGEIIPVGFDGDEQELWEEEREDLVKCIEEREMELETIAKELGINPEDIDNLSEVELSQKVNEIENEKKDEEEQQLSEQQVKKVKQTGMNEINTNISIDSKGTTLAQSLKLDEYTKIMVVHSYKLAEITNAQGENGRINNMSFGLIAQKADGTYETIPKTKLEQDRGSNNRIIEANDKDNVEVNKEDCRYKVPGTNYSLIINQKDPYGIPEVYLAQNTRDNDGQIAQKLQDRYDGTEKQDIEVRALFNKNKGINQPDKSVNEVKQHKKAECEELDIDEADGRKDTGHIHFNSDSQEQQNAIEEIMERGKVSRGEAEAKLEKELETTNEDISIEEAIENALDEINEEYRGLN